MTAGALRLPEGRPARQLAVAITLVMVAVIWFAAISPLLGWYQARVAELAQQQAIAGHMTALAAAAPQLRAAIAAAGPQSQDRKILLAGGTDAIAGANLQSALQDLAEQAGTSLDSSEVMPAQPVGALRQVGIEVSVTAPWTTLVAFLQAISTAQPRMIVDQLNVTNASPADDGPDAPVQASFTVRAFSAGAP